MYAVCTGSDGAQVACPSHKQPALAASNSSHMQPSCSLMLHLTMLASLSCGISKYFEHDFLAHKLCLPGLMTVILIMASCWLLDQCLTLLQVIDCCIMTRVRYGHALILAAASIHCTIHRAGSIGVVYTLKGMRGRRDDMTMQQQEDIAAVGSLMLRLAGASGGGPALQAVAGHLSPHLVHLLASLQNSHIRDCHMVRQTMRLTCLAINVFPMAASVYCCFIHLFAGHL